MADGQVSTSIVKITLVNSHIQKLNVFKATYSDTFVGT